MEELKPCKCGCGGEASVDYFIGEPSEGASYAVYCRKCEIHTMSYDTMTEAIEAWNTAMSGNKTGKRYSRLMAEYLAQDCFN